MIDRAVILAAEHEAKLAAAFDALAECDADLKSERVEHVLTACRRDEWKRRALLAEAQLSFSALRAANVERCKSHYHPIDEWSLTDWMCCVSGEAGELAGVIKNIRRAETEREENGHAIPRATLEQLGDEAADMIIYLDLLCARAGVNMGEAVRRKFNLVSRDRLNSTTLLPEATDE